MSELQQERTDLRIPISKKRVARVLITIVVILHIANAFAVWVRFTPVTFPFDDTFVAVLGVSGEGKIPTWYSATTLLFCSVLLALIVQQKRRQKESYLLHWTGLAIVFAFMSLDEATSIHEMATGPVRAALDTTGPFYYAWVIPGIIFVMLFGLVYIKFLLHLPGRTKVLFTLAGVVYLSGVLGMELIGSAYTSEYGWSLTYGVLASIEEIFEMAGVVIFVYALLDYLERHLNSVQLLLISP